MNTFDIQLFAIYSDTIAFVNMTSIVHTPWKPTQISGAPPVSTKRGGLNCFWFDAEKLINLIKVCI